MDGRRRIAKDATPVVREWESGGGGGGGWVRVGRGERAEGRGGVRVRKEVICAMRNK